MMLKRTALVSALLLGVGIIIFLVYLVVNEFTGPEWQTRELEINYGKWRAEAITHYRISVEIGCFCEFYNRMPLVVEVLDNKVVSIIDNKGERVSVRDSIRTDYSYLLTVDGIYSYAYDSIARADEVHVDYDPKFAYPTGVGVDWEKDAVDDELGVRITNFEPLP